MPKQRISLIIVFVFSISFFSTADEGLWLPKLIKDQESAMKSLGMQITAEEIYSEDNKSLKDAILHFGGGCTSSLISDQGLILTNHHCGYSRIQSHSSLENNYLANGFWAETFEEELPNAGLTVTRIISMKNVTSDIMEGFKTKMSDQEKATLIESNIKRIGENAINGTHYEYQIRPYYEGNQFYLILSEVFKDVRLVGAPPSSIGKFGFDTDNWIWPRHTGDFSLFRVYVGKDNKPADYSKDNIPYTPIKSLPISIKGIKEGDFTLVYGFPGTTNEYLYSKKLDLIVYKSLPIAIKMREKSLSVIDREIRASEEIAIKYAAKQSRISNGYKKWIGQEGGLKRFDALQKKKDLEQKFNTAISKDKKLQKAYGDLFKKMDSEIADYEKYYLANTLFREMVYYGPEILRFVNGMEKIISENDSLELIKESMDKRLQGFYKDFEPAIDEEIMASLLEIFFSRVDSTLLNDKLKKVATSAGTRYTEYSNEIYSESVFTNEKRLAEFIENYSGDNKVISSDPMYQLMDAFYSFYSENIQDKLLANTASLLELEKRYMTAQMEVLPNEKNYYPDANGTLRVSYGEVKAYKARDAVNYDFQTTDIGILEKADPDSYEFNIPPKLETLLLKKDFGKYGNEGKLPVCFLGTNHTSGGNSGSPAINAEGELIGLNFDRTWESTMSDMMFNPEICRNIMVDTRYILFVIDKFAGAKRLIEEMEVKE